jgi:hypothetical protein
LNARIPTIIFAGKSPSGADLGAVKVTMDGQLLAERLVGAALSIDPGLHTFTFETLGQPSVSKTFVIAEAQKDRRESITFGTPLRSEANPDAGQSASANRDLGTQKVLALVAGGVGVVGLGVGAAFGALAISKKSDAQSACPDQCATQDGLNKWREASSTGNIATVGFIAGGVVLAGAAVLWLTAPTASKRNATQLGLGLGSLQLKRTW